MDDIDTLRSVMTVVAFLTFAGIVLWAYGGRAHRGFEEAARLPLEEDTAHPQDDGRAAR